MISVLLVDDEPAILDIAQIFLEKDGRMKVTLSESAYDALQKLEYGRYDIIISDYEMPGMNGIELLKTVKGRSIDTPFIIFTGRGREHVAIEALNLGASFYLQKGGDPKSQFAELRNMIVQAIQRKYAEEEVKLNETRLEALIALHQMTSASTAEIVNYALEQVITLTRSRYGYLAFLNDDETVLSMFAWSRKAMDECQVTEKPVEFPVEKTGLWGESVRQRRPIITNDYAAPGPLKKGLPAGHIPLTRQMSVPIFDGSRITMVAGVANKPGDYEETDATQVTLLMGGVWQILKRKRAEEELKKSERWLRSYFDVPLVGIAITSPDMHWLSVNDKLCEILGYSREELMGLTWADITPPGDLPAELRKYQAVIAGEKGSKEFEKRYRTKDGRLVNVAVSAMPVRNESGEVDYFVAILQDVSPLKRAKEDLQSSNEQMAAALEELQATQDSLKDYIRRLEQEEQALRESEEKFRNVVESSPWGMYFYKLEADGRLVLTGCNPGADRILGIDSRGLVGKSFEEIFPDLMETRAPEIYRRIAGSGGTWSSGNVRYSIGGTCRTFDIEAFQTSPGRMVVSFQEISERLKAIEALQTSEEKYRDLVENISDVIYATDAQGVITYASPVITGVAGYTPGEVTGQPIFSFLRDEDVPVIRENFEKLAWEATAFNPFDVPIRVKSGEFRWFRIVGRPFLVGGMFQGVKGTFTCIHEQKKAKKGLEEREALLQSIFRAAPIGIGLVKDRVIQWMNEQVPVISGYARDELTGQSARMLYPDEGEFERVGREKYPHVWEEGVGTVESCWKRKDGNVIDVLIRSSPLNPADPSLGVVFTVLDITAKKRAESALEAMEKKYRELVDSIPDIIYMADTHGNITFINAAGFAALEVTAGEVIGKPLVYSLHPEDAARGQRIYEDLIITGSPVLNFECRFVARLGKGRIIPVITNVRAVYDPAGCVTGTLGVAVDITERKRSEDELRYSETRLRTIAEQIPGSLWTTDRDLVFTTSYGLGLSGIGLVTNQVVGLGLAEFYGDQPGASIAIDAHHQALNGESVSYTTTYRERIFSCHVEPLRDADGAIIGMLGVAFDVTEQQEAESALKESELLLRTFINAIPDPAYLIDAVGRIVGANASFARTHGETEQGILGKDVFGLGDGLEQDIRSHVQEAIRTGTSRRFEAMRQGHPYLTVVAPI